MVEKNGHRFIVKDTSQVFLTCEHASEYIPAEYCNLGLAHEQLCSSKDLYDPGAREITEYLSDTLNASALYADVSRLVIDYNRRCNAITKHDNTYHSCPLKTDLLIENGVGECMIQIPFNAIADKNDFDQEEKLRYEKYAVPYINSAYSVLDTLRQKYAKTYIVQIHSFFPVYNGAHRSVDICVLYDRAEESAQKVMQNLKTHTDLHIAGNDPWSMKDTDGVVFERVYDMDDVEVIAFDVNNKHLTTKEGIKKIAELLRGAIQAELTS